MHSIFKKRVDLEGNPIDENVEKGGQLTIFCKIKLVHNEKVKSVYEPRGPSGRSLSRFP